MAHLFVDGLTNIDCSILDPDRGLLGKSWLLDVELEGELDEQSMVLDFGDVKRTIKQLVDDSVDHKLLVPNKFSGTIVEKSDNLITVNFQSMSGEHFEHRSPESAITLLDSDNTNELAIIEFLHNQLIAALPNSITRLTLALRKEQDYAFYYEYSHGLKKHDGNCQRIAHGHRSRIQIWENGNRSRTWEQAIADKFNGIYLASEEDIVKQTDSEVTTSYWAEQGEFYLRLPKNRVHIMPNDSTVECIAEHLLRLIVERHPDSDIRVKAFEGINKGALASNH